MMKIGQSFPASISAFCLLFSWLNSVQITKPMSQTHYSLELPCYTEIKHTDWLKEVTWIGPSNQSGLFQHWILMQGYDLFMTSGSGFELGIACERCDESANQSHRGSLEGAFTIFCHLKLFSEANHLIVKSFFTSSNGLAYFGVKKSRALQ